MPLRTDNTLRDIVCKSICTWLFFLFSYSFELQTMCRSTRRFQTWREVEASFILWPPGWVAFVSMAKWRPGRKRRCACQRFRKRNLFLQCSESFNKRTGSIPSFRAQDTDERGLYKKLIDKFSAMYGRKLNIGFMLLEKLNACILNLLMTNYSLQNV
jgi:hypothetical protein